MYKNKVVLSDGTVLIDLTSDTVTEGALLQGYTTHDMTGAPITGTCTFDVDSSDATVVAAEMLEGSTGYARGVKLIGSMPNKGAVVGAITAADQKLYIPYGCHDGSGYYEIDPTERLKLIASNIKAGVTILNVTGAYSGEAVVVSPTVEVTPTFADQAILPEEPYDYMAQVVVKAIPITETPNAAGGITVTIG